jgi:hypothetical protein
LGRCGAGAEQFVADGAEPAHVQRGFEFAVEREPEAAEDGWALECFVFGGDVGFVFDDVVEDGGGGAEGYGGFVAVDYDGVLHCCAAERAVFDGELAGTVGRIFACCWGRIRPRRRMTRMRIWNLQRTYIMCNSRLRVAL